MVAHAGGLDEMAIILFPVLVGVGVWLLTRGGPKPPHKKSETRPPEPQPKPRTWI